MHFVPSAVISIYRQMNKGTDLVWKKNGKCYIVSFVFMQGDICTAVKLIKEGANPNAKDNAGWTPLVFNSFSISSEVRL